MMTFLRKTYLHFQDKDHPIKFRIDKLDERVSYGGATHYIEFQSHGMGTRMQINGHTLKLRRDLQGFYFMDSRTEHFSDRIICTREMRDEIYKIRPDISFCAWRELADYDD